MCLITTQQEPLIAEQDITTYKIVTKDLTPYYHGNYQYVLGELNETSILENNSFMGFDGKDDLWIDDHVGEYSPRARRECKTLKSFGQGFHSCIDSESLVEHKSTYTAMYQCTIPKGSEYYTNPRGLFISNKLIINKKIA